MASSVTSLINAASLASALEGAFTSLAAVAQTASYNRTSTTTTPTSTTEYIPLTTIFTPPKWCTDMPMTFFGDNSGLTSTFWKDTAFSASHYSGVDDVRASIQSCYPPHFEYQPDLFATDGYVYSPGVCPSGYYAAKSNGAHTGATTSWCCPSGMTFTAFQGCVSLTTPTSTTTLYQLENPIIMGNPYFVLEPYIPVAWASSDLTQFTPTAAPLSNRAQCIRALKTDGVSSAVLVDGGSNASAMDNPANQARGGLSTGVKAGIGVGVSVAAIAVIAMILLLLKYRQKAYVSAQKLKKRDETDIVELKNGIVISEADADSRAEADNEHYRAEADQSSSIKNELNDNAIRAEADGSNLRHELDSGWNGYEKDTSYR